MRVKTVDKAFVRCSAFEVRYSLFVINDQLKNRAAILFLIESVSVKG